MKKQVLLVMAIITMAAFGKDFGEGTVFGSGNFNGKSLGYGLGGEYSKSIKKIDKVDLALGLGLKYDSFDSTDKTEYATKVGTMPLYFNIKGAYQNYFVKGSLGYIIPLGANDSKLTNLKGGVYLGLGVGMTKDKYVVELNYDIANYEGHYSDTLVEYDDKVNYGKVSLILGYKFK